MVICRTPMRISFFGGGSDYPSWFEKHGGTVISTTINKYGYISLRYLPPFFEHKYRVVWSRIENVQSIDEIQHPVVKACLTELPCTQGVEIHYDGDLPARAGMASSSAFTVGLLHSLHALRKEPVTRAMLAREAIYIERDILKDTVGSQDQVAVAYGGLNKIAFTPDHNFCLTPLKPMPGLEESLLLLYTGYQRTASEIASTYKNGPELHVLNAMANEAVSIKTVEEFGKLLHESWQVKQMLSPHIATNGVNGIYDKAREKGAIGGKLLGAGGGGFLLLVAMPDCHDRIKDTLGLLHVPFKFEGNGSQIIFDNNE